MIYIDKSALKVPLKGRGGRGSSNVDKKFLNVNIINFDYVDKGGGFILCHSAKF